MSVENKYKSNVVNVNLTAFDELSKLSKIEKTGELRRWMKKK